ncbi:MAG: hypothetical protein F6K62_12225 [Sphaerospermopsis sp. SIO1G2]|nr:hypothetical protein [Sphaerospermopsis sp. SIO1G2]
MQTRKDDAAIPYSHEQDDGSFIGEPGLTKREIIAIILLFALLLKGKRSPVESLTFHAVKLTDFLITWLNELGTNSRVEKPVNTENKEWNNED